MSQHIPMESWGLLAEFEDEASLVQAARRLRESGYSRIDAFTPYPCEDLWEAVESKPIRISLMFLVGGLLGGCLGFLMQYYTAAHTYPWNVGGKPLNSWPMFFPITFELTILGAALFGFVGMWWSNRLPQPYHPLFNSPRFRRASQDGFFLSIEANDEKFDSTETMTLLAELGAKGVDHVDP